ncbi:lysis system i-spanin subunit Rz [Caballeronia sp. LZ034LL]|uniref:lysis system i-spanin subunit Rz n=1 Tax=Caballeronia sp. LZ034LL TaxID=3038567 RepID=UPI0028594335|nr:lysis system i-spanin subunit Rz [Caballeronia sp. LZ034LL]MDR5833365.1 lysis system i-spanin subunit Rz [Caballeronia sp. LZ034LL]
MCSHVISGLVAGAVGLVIGGTIIHAADGVQLAKEEAVHARDSEACAQKIKTYSEGVARAVTDSIATHNAAVARIDALDKQLHAEKTLHDVENAKNRAAIADGIRRLRVAAASLPASNHIDASNPSSATGVLGDGTSAQAELSPAVGRALFAIVDDADEDARAKAGYLQRYICALQQEQIIAGSCKDSALPE